MRDALYYPFMNLPESCAAFGSILLCSRDIHIIAPFYGAISDRLTQELCDERVIRILRPEQVLQDDNFEKIEHAVETFLATRGYRRGRLVSVHADKLGRSNNLFGVHEYKVHPGLRRLFHDWKFNIRHGFYELPEDVGMFLMTSLAASMSEESKFPLVQSSVTMSKRGTRTPRKVVNAVEDQQVLQFLPSVRYRNLKNIGQIIELRKKYGPDIRHYHEFIENKIQRIYEKRKYHANSSEIIAKDIAFLKEEYVLAFEDLFNKMGKQDLRNIFHCSMTMFSSATAICLATQSSVLAAGVAGLFAIGKELVSPFEQLSPRLAEHKVIFDINENYGHIVKNPYRAG